METGVSPYNTFAESAAAVSSGGEVRSIRPPPRCLQCRKTDKNLMELDCKIHSLCRECLLKKTQEDGAEDMYMCPADECVSSVQSRLPIHIFVDNSNIWIEAKKLGSKMKKFKTSEDYRVRINYGPLTDVVANGRDAVGMLYGSKPPDIDPVWDKIRKRGWKVEVLQKSAHTGKEKEVDSTIFKDILLLLKVSRRKQSTIVLISGDRDMRPAVEGILQEAKGWKIEICMWNRTISRGLRELEGKYKNVSIVPLDEHWSRVVYTENVAPSSYNPDKFSVVLTVSRGEFSKDERIDHTRNSLWTQLEQICKQPIKYKWMEGDEARHLLLVFNRKCLSESQTKVTELVQKLDENKSLLCHVERCEMYTNFKERQDRGPTRHVTDENGWTKIVSKRNKSPKPTSSTTSSAVATTCSPPTPVVQKKVSAPLPCCLGRNCEDGLNCRYSHSPEDKKYFSYRNGKGNYRRKTAICMDIPKHKPAIRCDFAHEESDRWCSKCHRQGHFCKDCPNPECPHPRHKT